ncbi:MAG TPA: Wadjet anti-phage system protein JetA family protein [Symbiobacteriaceae bacterium]|nr:Wadjet anti-phage system protein JetA family protein [Symbiobacteriaceae bacterium]
MELFDVIPERLFSVLASPARAVYAYVLFLIFDLHQQELYGTPREAVIDAAAAYLETEALADEELYPEGASGLSPRDKAGAVLRRLQETGWLEVEQRSDYQQYINLADYAIAVLDTLDKLRRRERAEYAGFVLATYVALTSEEADRNPGLAIGKAYDQTQQLVRDLKSLHANIKRYTEQLLRQKAPREILAMHFGEYKLQVLDRSYHRLKTTDNVSRYRPRILERLDRWMDDPEWLAATAADEVRRGRFGSAAEAEAALNERMAFLRSSYEQMDHLLDEIDRRNAQYAKSSLEQIRYLLSSGGDSEGQLILLLQLLGAQLRSGAAAPDEPWPSDWAGLFALHSVQALDNGSLFSPRGARRNHNPQALTGGAVSTEQRLAALDRTRRRLAAKLTFQRIDEFVQARLGDRRETTAAELGIESVEDFVRLIYIAAYSRNRRVHYTARFDGERVESASGQFAFRDIRIRKK